MPQNDEKRRSSSGSIKIPKEELYSLRERASRSEQAVAELREKAELYRALFEQNTAIKLLIDPEGGGVVDCNQAACDFYGYSREELCSLSITDINTLPREEVYEALQRALGNEQSVFHFQHRLASGEIRHTEVHSSPIHLEGRTLLFSVIQDITARRHIQKRLERRVEMENMISTLSTRLINSSVDEVDDNIHAALQSIGESVEADRSYVFFFQQDGETMDCTHEWCRAGVTPHLENLQNVTRDDHPWFLQRIQAMESFLVFSPEMLPQEASTERRLMEEQNINSLLCVPFAHEKTVYGFVGIDRVRDFASWDEDVVNLLRMVGEIIANAIARQKDERSLLHAYDSLRETNENLRRRDKIMEMVRDAAVGFLRQPNWRDAVTGVLEWFGQLRGALFVSLLECQDVEKDPVVRVSHFWAGSGEWEQSLKKYLGETIPLDLFPASWMERLQEGRELIYYADECFVPGHFGFDPIVNYRILTLPVFVGEDLRGFLRFASRPEERQWSEPEIDALQAMAGIIGAAIQGEERDEELRFREEQLHHSEKLSAIGRLAGGVAHDFNNLLTVVVGYSELLLDLMEEDHPWYQYAEETLMAAQRAHDLTRQLLAFSRKQKGERRWIELNRSITNILRMLRRLIGENIFLDFRPTRDSLELHLDPAQLDQVLMNLVINARDAVKDNGGRIVISTRRVSFEEDQFAVSESIPAGSYIALSVSDDGMGMSAESARRVFEPFFTTKPQGEGTGMGLALVYGIVKQYNGYIQVHSGIGEGTRFTIYFPEMAEQESTGPVEMEPAMQNVQFSGTVLLAEDEEIVRNLVQGILERMGFKVLPAADGTKALELAREQKQELTLLVTDVVMPELNGKGLTQELEKILPSLPVLFLSGYPNEIAGQDGQEELMLMENQYFLEKPFSPQTLTAKISEVLGSWSSTHS